MKNKTQFEAEKEANDQNFELISEYIGINAKHLYKCKKCGEVATIGADHMKYGYACRSCDCYNKPKSQFEAQEEALFWGLKLLGRFINTRIKCAYECLDCKLKFSRLPKFKNYSGCRRCKWKSRKKLNKGDSGFNYLFASYRSGAKFRNYSFELNKDEFKQMVLQSCFWCGTKPENYTISNARSKKSSKEFKEFSKFGPHSGVDRVNNFIGYNKDNCVACCSFCNRVKGTMSAPKWFEFLARIKQQPQFTTNQIAKWINT